MIVYRDTADDVAVDQIEGFFHGRPRPPSPEAHLRILLGSYWVVLAVDPASSPVAGFAMAISDGVSCAYIPHL